jgi:glycosyltransferase involved in cell wall biosynthesis
MIADLDASSRVHLVGYVQEADALINEAAVVVMSSREEGLGSVVLHALALGKPVVATRAGGLPEIVGADWLADVGDARGLASRVVQALERTPITALPERHTARAMSAAIVATYRALI